MLAKAQKLARLAMVPSFVRGLRHGVAATIEHEPVLSGLDIRTVVDVGANKGQFALLARHLWPQAMVHAFEPLPAPADRFARLFQGDHRVRLHRYAIGPAAGEADMHISRREDSSSLLPIGALQTEHFPGTEEVGRHSVRVARLDEVLAPADIEPDALLKIDVQGYEGEVIEGSTALLPLFRYVYCEISFKPLYDGQELAPKVIERLAGHGFRLQQQRGAAGAVQVDALFVR